MGYTKEPNHKDFLEWIKKEPDTYEMFFYDCILDCILREEQCDYFGTEGFDKRFG